MGLGVDGRMPIEILDMLHAPVQLAELLVVAGDFIEKGLLRRNKIFKIFQCGNSNGLHPCKSGRNEFEVEDSSLLLP